MSQVLLGQSYYLRFDPKQWEAMMPYPPLGTLYAAAICASVATRSACSTPCWPVARTSGRRRWTAHKPRFAIIYEDSFNYLSKMCLTRMREAAFKMTAAAKARGCTVIISGSDATDHAGSSTSRRGRRDHRRRGRSHPGRAAGPPDRQSRRRPGSHRRRLAWPRQAHDGQRAASIRDLDALPFPAWDLVDIPKLQAHLDGAPRLLFDEHGHHARLPLSLQLVRQADLRPALQRALARKCRRRAASG